MTPQISHFPKMTTQGSGSGDLEALQRLATAIAMGSSGGPTSAFEDMANEADGSDGRLGLWNSEALDLGQDGWAMLARYGDHPHKLGLQRFGRPEADMIVRYFRETWNKVRRAVVGAPIYVGHPDVPGLANQYPDKTVYGSIADLAAREDGLYFRPVLTPDGSDQVLTKGKDRVSPI